MQKQKTSSGISRRTSRVAIPKEWTFDNSSVASGFDGHVRRQLPWYDLATALVCGVARDFIPPSGGLVFDVGAGTGNVGRVLAPTLKQRSPLFRPIEPAPSMARVYQGPGTVEEVDALSIDFSGYDVVIIYLAMMFFPVVKRGEWLKALVRSGKPGSAVILVEKFRQYSVRTGEITHRILMQSKLDAGETPEDVLAKESSLMGVQVPLDLGEIPPGDLVFCWGDFRGYLFHKPLG